jgi:type III restriction enzyme
MSRAPTVEDPIINSAFEEPHSHWVICKDQPPLKQAGRRPASYYFRIPEGAVRGKGKKAKQVELFEDSDKPGDEIPLEAANLIRTRLAQWRERNYEGATGITKELLALWNDQDRKQRLFFAQREAAEAVILLVEGPPDLLQGLDGMIPWDEPSATAKTQGYRAFRRYALKMATGAGKTTVMAMLAAWSILNRLFRPDDERFADTVLIICPNVTIRDRLRELDPEQGDHSLYATRKLVPQRLLPELRRGDVIVTNWHNLARQELKDVNGVSAKVVKRGVPVTKTVTKTIDGQKVEAPETQYLESDTAFVRRILRNRKGHSPTILVFNDEAHHAYRRGNGGQEVVLDREMADLYDREATVWIEGLDRINKVLNGNRKNGVRLCVDLSATPFYIQGSGNEVGRPFPWVISDFGLLDAIEAGMVKVPMLPWADITGNERPAYFNIWRWAQGQLEAEGITGELTPQDILRYAAQPISLLAQEWEETAATWAKEYQDKKRFSPAPPVFIIVCRDTALAKEVYAWLSDGKPDDGPAPAYFRNQSGKPVTTRVDSKVAEEIESGSGSDEAKRLRFILETIGKTTWPGDAIPDEYAAIVAKHNAKAVESEDGLAFINPATPPGRDIRCIISVAMLTEGWDATTVTHIVGLRPFGSQLLCEQVVGRALRRTHYGEENGLLIGEEAKVLGVPFELVPFKVKASTGSTAEPEIRHIFAVEDKSAFAITFPIVEGYDEPSYAGVVMDWDKVHAITLDPLQEPDSVLVRPMVAKDGSLLPYSPGQSQEINLTEWRQGIREQQVVFQLAAVLTQRVQKEYGDAVPSHRLFPQLLVYCREFLASKLELLGGRMPVDIALAPYFLQAIEALQAGLTPIGHERSEAERPRISPGPAGVGSTDSVDFFTTRNVWNVVAKCHLNACVADTQQWEQSAAYCLDVHPGVAAWVKNDHVGLHIRYRKAGRSHNYIPDFIVRLNNGRMLIIETKGQLGDALIKSSAAERWVKAVNREKRFGQWSYHLVTHPAKVMALLDEQTGLSAPAALFQGIESAPV